MKLGTDECTRALNKYMKDVAKDEIDKVCVETLFSNDPIANINIIDSFLVNYNVNDHNTIMLTIVNRIRDIRTSLGIEESKLGVEDIDDYDEPITPDINDAIDIYKESLMGSLSALIDNYKDNSQDKTLEEFCYTIERFIEGLNCIFLDSFKGKNTNINHGKKDNKKKELHNRMKANNLKIIK